MIAQIRGSGRLPLKVFTLLLGFSVLGASSARADDDGPVVTGPVHNSPQPYTGIHLLPGPPSFGTLGYGPPGLQPGYQGFGLGYHLGYGYGGDALGVGADGGYPFYGGPGYPHCMPQLGRIGGIVPFPYFGGPGYPTPDHPDFFGEFGPLVPDQPVVTIVGESGQPIQGTGYGSFTGAVTNAEAQFAPFTARAAAGVSSMRARSSNPANSTTPLPDAGFSPPRPSPNPTVSDRSSLPVARQFLGIEAEPVVDAGGVRGMKITKIYPGSAAERTGLHEGDVIHAINDYVTQQPGNLEWIYVNAAPNNVLKMNVRSASDGKEQNITAQFP